MKKGTKEINIMEGIDFKKNYYKQRKYEKTRRIQEQARKRRERKIKIALTIETIVISAIIYVLTGILGELAQSSTFYSIVCVSAWIWLFFGQFGAFYCIWACDYEK